MHIETKFLRLFQAVELGDDVDGWRVCWLGGWDKCRVLFVVMVCTWYRLPFHRIPSSCVTTAYTPARNTTSIPISKMMNLIWERRLLKCISGSSEWRRRFCTQSP